MQIPVQSEHVVLVSLLLSFKTSRFDLIINMNKLLLEVFLENGSFKIVAKTSVTFLKSIYEILKKYLIGSLFSVKMQV